MAIKTNNPQPGVAAQADRPPVFGQLVAGVVVIKVLAGIKGESVIGAPEYDWIAEGSESGTTREPDQGLSIPPVMGPPADSGADAPYTMPLAHQVDESPKQGSGWDEGIGPSGAASGRSHGSTGVDGLQPANTLAVQAPDAHVAVRAASGDELSANSAGNSAGRAPAGGGDEGAVSGKGGNQTEDGSTDGSPGAALFGSDTADETTDTPYGDRSQEGSGRDDSLTGGAGDDNIDGLAGDDTLDGREGDDSLYGGSDDDRLLGGDGDDQLDGGGGDDRLSGGGGDDSLDGGAGADRLFGLDGDDLLIGGLGRDELSGGEGADHFVLKEIAASDAQDPDRLLDFRAFQRDKIDVSGIDADSQTAQNEAFAFIEDDPFSGSAGELRFTEAHGATYLQGDVNGDGEADFALELLGVSVLSVDDIVL